MEQITYKLEDFEGPLDLLLHFVAQRKMELFSIRILEVIDQYLAFIGEVKQDTLDPTSEFIEMAARLVQLKSAALLPRQEEAEQIQRVLEGQLIEYYLCKQAASKLRDMSEGVHFYVREPLVVTSSEEYTTKHEVAALLAAYIEILGRESRVIPPDIGSFDPIVTAPIVSVSSRVVHILRGIKRGTIQKLSDLFMHPTSRSAAVATFLGVLELIRGKRITVDEEGNILVAARGKGENSEHQMV